MPIIDAKATPATRSRKSDKLKLVESSRTIKGQRRKLPKIPRPNLGNVISAIPLVCVNLVASIGQYEWASRHLTQWDTPAHVLYAVTLESIALSVSYNAHTADLRNDKSGTLKLAAYALALTIGILNYHNFAANGWDPTPLACVEGLFSAISPWLWGVRSKTLARNILIRNGLVEGRGIRLGIDRWIWHPIRSIQIKRECAWSGNTNLKAAINDYDHQASERAASKAVSMASKSLDHELAEL